MGLLRRCARGALFARDNPAMTHATTSLAQTEQRDRPTVLSYTNRLSQIRIQRGEQHKPYRYITVIRSTVHRGNSAIRIFEADTIIARSVTGQKGLEVQP